MATLVPVILAGGTGTRLWPLSRRLFPKQFQVLAGEHSMLQETLLRLQGLRHTKPIVVCSEEHRFLAAEQCRQIDVHGVSIILEPEPKNTAPAIALAALQALQIEDDPVLVVLPSDHHIGDPAAFRALVDTACNGVDDHLMTFGVVPSGPETGYGYIRAGQPAGATSIARVDAFIEKPDRKRAEDLLKEGGHYWNSGMFVFRAAVFLDELARLHPDIHAAVSAAFEQGDADLDFFRPGERFAECPSESIDYAVMERTDRACVIPADIGWNDVGSWSALWEISPQDEHGNTKFGDVVDIGSRNSFIHAGHRLVATVGIEDSVVVETRDAVLVARKDQVQAVKDIVAELQSRRRSEHEAHVQVFRPWGSFQGLESGPGFQVKRITVKPGASLSLQMHHHRSEHWIVVSGTATVTRDDDEFVLRANESTYIPVGTRHRLANPGDEPLELIEVQVGGYLGEDDIVRFEDNYGRA